MQNKKLRFIIVGLGHHAKRVYLPYLKSAGIELAGIVEIDTKVEETRQYLTENGLKNTPIVSSPYLKEKQLPKVLAEQLNRIEGVDAIIISTDPQVHMPYSRWAISQGLNILLDKPISTYRNVANSNRISQQLIDDYDELRAAYASSPDKAIVIAVQRRYHPGFDIVRGLVNDMSEKFNIPVTSISAHHSDGQWRMPSELETMTYHGFTDGNGKLSHSGYHLFDSLSQIVEDSYKKSRRSVEKIIASAYFTKPEHIINQLDYSKIFEENVQLDHVPDFTRYGEHDAAVSGQFSCGEDTRTLFTISLLHNSISDRHWIQSRKDLYKKNGRIKHEFLNIHQGPLQNIQVHSFQSKSDHDDPFSEGTGVGTDSHFEIHVFKNAAICGGVPYEIINANEKIDTEGKLITEGSKQIMCQEFVAFCKEQIQKKQLRSEVSKHGVGVALLAVSYRSGASNGKGIEADFLNNTWHLT